MSIAAPQRQRRLFGQAIAASAFLAGTAAVAAASPAPPVVPSVSAPAIVNTGEPRDTFVTITNVGTAPVLVLPNLVRLRIEGIGAQFVPYPGPPVDPWGGVHELAPGASASVVFLDAYDKRGVWRLAPGSYRIVASYDVPADVAPPAGLANPGRAGRGRVEGAAATMSVR